MKKNTSSAQPTPSKKQSSPDMSKLSESLKALINAAHAKPHTVRAPANIKSVYTKIAEGAAAKNVGTPAWLTMSTAATMTMNSPESLLQLFQVSSKHDTTLSDTQTAELMREVGLKCISFNGIPRSINLLGAFRDSLPKEIQSSLSTQPTRSLNVNNIQSTVDRGRGLWTSIYRPFETKLVDKLALSHPNLPVHILDAHYGTLLSDPSANVADVKVGRVLTSIVAVACLRAQTGVGPQVLSHVFGLRKAFEDGSASAAGEQAVEGGEWLASEQGNEWILNSVDEIVMAIGGREGSTFAPGMHKAKL